MEQFLRHGGQNGLRSCTMNENMISYATYIDINSYNAPSYKFQTLTSNITFQSINTQITQKIVKVFKPVKFTFCQREMSVCHMYVTLWTYLRLHFTSDFHESSQHG